MNKIVYISDFFVSDIIGGGELNDHELLSLLQQDNYSIFKKRSNELDLDFIKKNINAYYIISNFIRLGQEQLNFIKQKCRYSIYEHDHKYMKTRNPAFYEDLICSKEDLINVEFYKKAERIFCQSSFHKNIINSNLNLNNVVNLSGNLWSLDSLEYLRELAKIEKQEKCSILYSSTPHKNTSGAIFYCNKKDYQYELVESKNYKEFLSLLGNNKTFVFFPETPETLSRVVVEARMMNMSVISNKNIGAVHEPWFEFKGEKLIDFMLNKRKEISDIVKEAINE